MVGTAGRSGLVGTGEPTGAGVPLPRPAPRRVCHLGGSIAEHWFLSSSNLRMQLLLGSPRTADRGLYMLMGGGKVTSIPALKLGPPGSGKLGMDNEVQMFISWKLAATFALVLAVILVASMLGIAFDHSVSADCAPGAGCPDPEPQ